MPKHPIPSLTALRAFDLVARLGTFTKAARKLNVTRPAISKQIKGLEAAMGCQLVIRSGPKVMLTEHGAELAGGLRQAFDLMLASTHRTIENAHRPETVRILVERDFASSWLAERIGAFLIQNQGISVEINAERNGHLRQDEDFGFRIFYGTKGRYATEHFAEAFLCDWIDIPLCAPDYKFQNAIENGCYDGVHFLLDKNYNPWETWFEKTGFKSFDAQAAYTSFNDTTLCLSAALAGAGITIGDSFLSLSSIEGGRLVAPFKSGLRSQERYVLCYPKGRGLSKHEKTFQIWLTQTIKDYEKTVEQVLSKVGIKVITP